VVTVVDAEVVADDVTEVAALVVADDDAELEALVVADELTVEVTVVLGDVTWHSTNEPLMCESIMSFTSLTAALQAALSPLNTMTDWIGLQLMSCQMPLAEPFRNSVNSSITPERASAVWTHCVELPVSSERRL
jgi:hypothetical protein